MAWRVRGVPIDCAGAPHASAPAFGTECAPAAVREAGLLGTLRAVGAADGGDLPVRVVGSTRDPSTGLVGGLTVAESTRTVRSAVRATVLTGDRPLLLGGCCTLLPGALAGLTDARGPAALLYLDGHLDLYDTTSSPTGEAADMPVAVALGRGDPQWLDAVAPAPLLTLDRLALVGHRDADEEVAFAAELSGPLGEAVWSAAAVRRAPTAVGQAAAERVAASGAPVWLHLDVDVLDEAAFPATDYLMPGGPDRDQVEALVAATVRTTELAGLSIGCYNPEKDADGSGAQFVVRLVALALGC